MKDPLGAMSNRMDFFGPDPLPETYAAGAKRRVRERGQRIGEGFRGVGQNAAELGQGIARNSRLGRDAEASAQQRRAWSENTLRGGPGEYFRGHTTPKDVYTAQNSGVFKNIRKALEKSDDSVDIASLIEDNEYERNEYRENLVEQYKAAGHDSNTAEMAAQRDLKNSKLPTQQALQRETDMHMERMVQRSDKLESRQSAIAENSAKWASNIGNTATAFGVIGTMATSALGIQNGLVDGALLFANGIGAVGMLLPGIMEKAVSGVANLGVTMLDKFDGTRLGTKIGAQLGDTMGTTMTGRMSKAFAGMGAMFMTALPYLAGIAAAALVIKGIWDLNRKDSEAYVKTMKEANKSAELHAELLGYVRNEQESIEDMSYEEATDVRANAYRDNEDGRSQFVRDMRDINVGSKDFGGNTSQSGRIENLNAVLSKEAIRIIGDGGDSADVRSMVAAALQAAGVSDPQIIEDVKLHFKNFDITADEIWAGNVGEEVQKKMGGEGTARSSGDQTVNSLSAVNPFSADSRWTPRDYDQFSEYDPRDQKDIEEAYRRPSETSREFVEGEINTFTAAMNNASTDEARQAVTSKFIEMMDEGLKAAEASGDNERIGTVIRQNQDMIRGALEDSDMAYAAQFLTEDLQNLQKSQTALQSVLGGENQEAFNTPAEAAKAYERALKELEEQGIELSDQQKLALHNSIGAAGGMDHLADSGRNADGSLIVATARLGLFNQTLTEAEAALKNMSAQESIDFITAPDEDQMEQNRLQVEKFSDTINNTPAEFTRRWQLTAEVNVDNEQENVDQFVANSRKAIEAGAKHVTDEASRQFKDRQDATFDQIKAESEAAGKALDAKQKASNKAFEARSKALDSSFKAQTKDLENKQKEEGKAFNKRQREDKKLYDKQEKAQQKEFSKQQEAEREAFDKSWDDRGDSISGYYDNAIKAIEDQGKAEEKLEELRQRNSERERKRREYLANMANTNIDINVAVAGGDLDEAARLSNSAASASTDYYQDQIDTESGYDLQDRNAARGDRTESLGLARTASMDEFGRLRDDASEGFDEKQELEQEKIDEQLDKDRELYEERKALEAEQFAEKQALEQERLQAEQERQREALEAEKEALQERHAAEREMIQETARVKEDGARRHFEATQRALDMEIQELMSRLPTSHAEIEGWVKEVEGTYANHGVYLNEDFAPSVQNGMMEAAYNAMDIATNEVRQDAAWKEMGEWIGRQLRDGTLRGYGLEQAVSAIIFGNPLGEPLYPEATPKAQSETASMIPLVGGHFGPGQEPIQGLVPQRRAKGGPIYGPGTETSDSIPALLSNGEHVLTAKEVKAAGGHKAVERLRSAIKSGTIGRFAVGGGVGTSTGTPGSEELNVTVASTGTGTVADGGVMSALTTDVSNMGSTFDDTLTNTVSPAWQQFGDMMVKVKKDSIDPVLEGSKVALAEYAAQTNQIMSANMNPAWVQFGQNLKMVKEGVFDVVMTDMKAGISTLSSSISTAISNEIMPKWTEGSNHIRTMQDTVIDPAMQATRDATTATAQNFGTAADMIGTGWDRVKENTAAPVRYTIDTVFNKGLVGMWNEVADKLDLETFKPHPLAFAQGGVLPGYTPGRDVHEFSSPTGGRLHLSGGEAIMRPEWTRAVGGPSAVAQMNSAARKGKLTPESSQALANGGVVGKGQEATPKWKRTVTPKDDDGGPRTGSGQLYENMPKMKGSEHNLTYEAVLLGRSVSLKFPEVSTIGGYRADGYEDHPSGTSLDIMTSPIGTTTPGGLALGDAIVRYIYDNNAAFKNQYIIWKQALHYPDGSVQPMEDRGSITQNHFDHVHTRAIPGPRTSGEGVYPGPIEGAGTMMFGQGAGGGSGINAVAMAAYNQFNEKMQALRETVGKWTDAAPDSVMSMIPQQTFDPIASAMQSKMSEKVSAMSGSAGGGVQWQGIPGVEQWGPLVEKLLGLKNQPASFKAAVMSRISQESSGDPNSTNNWDSNAKAGWPTKGLMQMRDDTFMSYVDPGMTNIWDPEHNLRSSMNYVINDPKYNGRTLQDVYLQAGGYDEGGIATGKGFMTKNVISPERVLSPRQTQAFERLVPAMDRVALGGVSEDQFMAKTEFDRDAAYKKMIERNSTAQIDFTDILEKLTPIITQLTGQLKGMVVPAITGYANDLIKLDTDAQRIDKVSEDIVNALTGIQIPEINTDMQFNVGGNIYGDAQLNAILEQWKQQTIREVQMQQAIAQQAIGGK